MHLSPKQMAQRGPVQRSVWFRWVGRGKEGERALTPGSPLESAQLSVLAVPVRSRLHRGVFTQLALHSAATLLCCDATFCNPSQTARMFYLRTLRHVEGLLAGREIILIPKKINKRQFSWLVCDTLWCADSGEESKPRFTKPEINERRLQTPRQDFP